MIRSVLREKSKDFFDILKYDRTQWMGFWNRYIYENHDFLGCYCEALHLNDITVRERLLSLERRFLDRLMIENDGLKSLKAKTAWMLSSLQLPLKLNQSDFTFFMVGALGLQDYTCCLANGRMIVIMDIVALKKSGHLTQMPERTVEVAFQIRKMLDTSAGTVGSAQKEETYVF